MNTIKNNNENPSFEQYNYLMDTYIEMIIKLIDTSYSMKILPFKIVLGLNYVKNYVKTNRFDVLQDGFNYLLTNKETILNFNIENLDELDEDSDDNTSMKSCVANIKKSSHYTQSQNNQVNFVSNSDDMLNLLIEIKNNAKKLSIDDIEIIKKYFELLIVILEQIQKIFI